MSFFLFVRCPRRLRKRKEGDARREPKSSKSLSLSLSLCLSLIPLLASILRSRSLMRFFAIWFSQTSLSESVVVSAMSATPERVYKDPEGGGLVVLLVAWTSLLLVVAILTSLLLVQDAVSQPVECRIAGASIAKLPGVGEMFERNVTYAFANMTVVERSKARDTNLSSTRDCVLAWPEDSLQVRIDRIQTAKWCVGSWLAFTIGLWLLNKLDSRQ
jgi:hypothetical protein